MNDTEDYSWKPDYSVTPRRVVCAANRHEHTGLIICGARHWDKIMRAQNPYATPANFEQGFIDQFGDWMTREEAWQVAMDQGQIRRRCGGDDGRLFSENLY